MCENFSFLRPAVLELFAKKWKLGLICQQNRWENKRNSQRARDVPNRSFSEWCSSWNVRKNTFFQISTVISCFVCFDFCIFFTVPAWL